MSFKLRLLAIILAVSLLFCLVGCKDESQNSSMVDPSENSSSQTSDTGPAKEEIQFSSDDYETPPHAEAVNVTLDGKTLNIGKAGEYIISGSIEKGQIVIDTDKKSEVKLFFKGVSITSDLGAAVYVKKAKKVTITLMESSVNTLVTNGQPVTEDSTNVDGAIFTKSDLTLNGKGNLSISTKGTHGIVVKDTLTVTGGNYNFDTYGHGVAVKDSLKVSAGDFTLKTGQDGLHTENVDDTSLGNLYIVGGKYDITSTCDGISASNALYIGDGEYSITAGGGAEEGSKAVSGGFGFYDKFFGAATTDEASSKGIKSAGDLNIKGGKFKIDTADDALHSNAAVCIESGEFSIASGDDGIHADTHLSVLGGKIDITRSYEGLEGNSVTLSGGEVSLVSSDDGINAAGGNDQSGFGGAMRPDQFASADSFVKITGGKLSINAMGDGIDSNGAITVTGGETYVSGPTNSANGALDFGGKAAVSGGIFLAAGSSGMAANFTEAEGQGAMLLSITGTVDTELILLDSKGNTVLSHKFEKAFTSVVITCPEIKNGNTYTVKAGSSSVNVEMTTDIYGASGGMGGPGGGGMMGPGGGKGGPQFRPR